MRYDTIFFDLDHTLWDFKTNSHEALTELSGKYRLMERGIPSIDHFMEEYVVINEKLWDDYRKGLIDKQGLRYERFYLALLKFSIDDRELSENIGNDYTAIAPYKTNLFPDAIDVLEYLHKKYPLYIITNGFEEVQHLKMKSSKLDKYFSGVITSERSGYKKPDQRMFEFSMKIANTKKEKSLMIGDSLEADVLGAKEFGMEQVYFNPEGRGHSEQFTHEIRSLNELRMIL
ncbi:MAG: YjjG family noncanonical pyrimidine nucleotidase [Bacteroidia bacterium]